MKIAEILAKIAKGEDLTDEEKAYAETYEEPNVEAVANAMGKKERLKREKEIADLKSQLAEREAEIEDVSSSASELEKAQKQIEKLMSQKEATMAQLESERQAHANSVRTNKLKSVDVPWLPNVSEKYRDAVIGEAFDGIDTEDLSDPNVVKPIIKGILESQSSFITASTPSGAGTGVSESANISEGSKLTKENVTRLKGKDLLDNLEEAFAIANQGE